MPAPQPTPAAPASHPTAAIDPVAELLIAPDGCILECSPAAAALLGLAEPRQAQGVHLSLFCRDAERLSEALDAAAVTGRLERWDADLVRLDGKGVPAVVDLVAIFEPPRTLASLRVAIKPVSAWRLAAAGPVAVPAKRDEASQLSHELNNLLAIVSGHAECLLTPDGTVHDGAVEAIRAAVSAAAHVSARVRGLSHKLEPAARAVNADALLAAVQDELRRTFGHRLAVAVQPAPHPWTVTIDRAIVHHALTAIAADAVEVMPHGGTLTFRTMNVEVGARRPSAHLNARPGRYVRVEVSYLTSAVPVAARPQRRDSDKGGLAALEALRRAGGRLMAESDGVRVASAVLLLPSDGVTVLTGRDATASRPSGKTVLLVERDATHCRLLQAVLRGQGHDVDTASSLAEAVHRLDQISDVVLVTDTLPGQTAAARAAWVAAHPDVRLLGTSETVARALTLLEHPRRTLAIERPLTAGRLIEAVAALLAGRRAGDVALDADPLAPLWLKHDDGGPIYPGGVVARRCPERGSHANPRRGPRCIRLPAVDRSRQSPPPGGREEQRRS